MEDPDLYPAPEPVLRVAATHAAHPAHPLRAACVVAGVRPTVPLGTVRSRLGITAVTCPDCRALQTP